MFPIVLIALLLIVQVGLVVRDALTLQLAAREGVRAVVVSASDDDAVEAVHRAAGPLDADRIDVVVSPGAQQRVRGGPVTVTLAYEERLRIPIVDRMISTVLQLHAEATMTLERSPPGP